jgi:hypothetical protein
LHIYRWNKHRVGVKIIWSCAVILDQIDRLDSAADFEKIEIFWIFGVSITNLPLLIPGPGSPPGLL